MATILGVSVSTVRRMEGRQLHPTQTSSGVHVFDPDEVLKLASTSGQANDSRPDRATRHKLSAGELAAEVFERFEQRHSLSEIVRALRIEPRKVRKLYHEWRTSLERGELRENKRAIPISVQTHFRGLGLEKLLSELPKEQAIRFSAALGDSRFPLRNPRDKSGTFDEIGGFIAYPPLTIKDLRRRFGSGRMWISAYSLAERRLLWNVVELI
ncbi:MAG: hypothetical protein AAGC55_07165 [Myxococcota bacterium]